MNNCAGYLDFEMSGGTEAVTHNLRVSFYKDETGSHCYMTSRVAFEPYGDEVAEIPLIPWEEGEKLVGRKVDPSEIKG